jgi:hypothetical protein
MINACFSLVGLSDYFGSAVGDGGGNGQDIVQVEDERGIGNPDDMLIVGQHAIGQKKGC